MVASPTPCISVPGETYQKLMIKLKCNKGKKSPYRVCFSKLSIKVGQNYAGKTDCVFAMCLFTASVPSCPSPSSVSKSKRLAFELLWKWSMPYGQSRCGLTWFGFNTSPQEVHKASRSSFVMLVIFLRGPVEHFAFSPYTVVALSFALFSRQSTIRSFSHS